jgi:hypothetical protein
MLDPIKYSMCTEVPPYLDAWPKKKGKRTPEGKQRKKTKMKKKGGGQTIPRQMCGWVPIAPLSLFFFFCSIFFFSFLLASCQVEVALLYTCYFIVSNLSYA